MDEKFVADIVPMDIFVASKNYDIITFYDSRRVTHRADDVSIIVLIAISGTAIMTAFGIGEKFIFAPETESHTWDSLSFSCSVADFSTSKIQFRSLESLSDDSYINSLDEAISYKASIAHSKSFKNISPKPITNITISELSVGGPLK
ncbi:hypothetical protein DINM_020527 [Dirofilaria immitis]|nr:hypothetical protein [Dirofilaria immitis]